MAESVVLQARRELEPPTLLEGRLDDGTLNKTLLDYVWQDARPGWLALLFIGLAGTGLLHAGIVITIARGIGMWGNNIPVAWAFGIINFVWWIGIGHAGTLISPILLLFQQKRRTSINRFPEAMTHFALLQTGLLPCRHPA